MGGMGALVTLAAVCLCCGFIVGVAASQLGPWVVLGAGVVVVAAAGWLLWEGR